MSVGGLKISGARRGEWIVSHGDTYLEAIPLPVSYSRSVDPDIIMEQKYRPYYLRRLVLFGRELNVWVPDFAVRSETAMNEWGIENLLTSNVSNALRMYGVVPPRTEVA